MTWHRFWISELDAVIEDLKGLQNRITKCLVESAKLQQKLEMAGA